MRQTTPEQIRGIQARSMRALHVREGASFRERKDNQWDTPFAKATDVRFQTASGGVVDLFGSQQLDIMRRSMPSKSNHWAVWWSDLMMTMFIMFAALYAFQMPKDILPPQIVKVPLPPQENPLPPEPAISDSILERTFEATRDAVLASGLDGVIAVRLVPEKSLRISVAGDLLFEGNKPNLKPAASTTLHVLSEALKKAPYKITVVGHTDNSPVSSPAFASNWELSTARACAVGRALILEGGMPSERLIMTGLGDQQPLQPNTSAANMAVNRRIDLVLSVENPTDALADEKIAAATQENMRRWMVKSDTGQGEGTWNAKR